MKKALITGITGQDGSYLAELLISKGYEVHGVIRRASTFNTHRIDHIYLDPHEPGARKFYQASSSEMFGSAPPPQNEQTPFRPRSPYAAAKLYSFWMTVNYREAYNLFACNGILFNHESPRRGETFVSRKITRALANILAGKQKKLFLGNLEAKRDWGFAPEFVQAMWLMLQQPAPRDFVIGTGESHSVRELL